MEHKKNSQIDQILDSLDGMRSATLQTDMLPDIYAKLKNQKEAKVLFLSKERWAVAACLFLLVLNASVLSYHYFKPVSGVETQTFSYDPLSEMITDYSSYTD